MKHTNNLSDLIFVLKHIVGTTSIIVGFIIVLGTVGSYELDAISTAQALTQNVLGFALCAVGGFIFKIFKF